MSENWFPHVRDGEKGPTACMIDLQHRGGVPRCPSVTVAAVRMRDPDASGMGTHEESSCLDDLFDVAVSELQGLGAHFVARTRGQGLSKYWVYAPPARRAELERLIRGTFPDDTTEFQHRDDPSWDYYRRLLPTAAEERLVQDQMVVQALQSHGDPLTPKRDVRHFSYFDSEQTASRYGEMLRREGFKIELSAPTHERETYGVIASRDDSVTLEAINAVTTSLSERARALGGVYDGWEAGLAKPRGFLARLFSR